MNQPSQMQRFVEIVAKLRAPGGCPWDREQTHATLKSYLLEETHEVLDAIDENSPEHLKEELGDLLLQVVLHAQIAADDHKFTIEDVARDISDKMIRRHPHVFGDADAKDSATVLKNWDEIKLKEKQTLNKSIAANLLDDIPKSLPALFEAHKLSKKAAKQGFDWDKADDVLAKINEEISEIQSARQSNDNAAIEDECGDLLFAAVNFCRKLGVNAELALKRSNTKFRTRFAHMEMQIKDSNIDPKSLTLQQWDTLWTNSKNQTRS